MSALFLLNIPCLVRTVSIDTIRLYHFYYSASAGEIVLSFDKKPLTFDHANRRTDYYKLSCRPCVDMVSDMIIIASYHAALMKHQVCASMPVQS